MLVCCASADNNGRKQNNDSYSVKSNTTDRKETDMKMIVYDSLKVGEENGISQKDLARILNMNERQLREEVAKEREAGALICSSDRGYYRAKNRAEIENTYNRLRSRALGTLAMLKPFAERLKREDVINEQMNIDDYLNGDS